MGKESIVVAVGDELNHINFGKGIVKKIEKHSDGAMFAFIHFTIDEPEHDRMFEFPLKQQYFIDEAEQTDAAEPAKATPAAV